MFQCLSINFFNQQIIDRQTDRNIWQARVKQTDRQIEIYDKLELNRQID